MLLYDSAVSGNCYKVRLLLSQLGIPFERRELSVVDRTDRAEVIGHLNPGLRVPTLVLDDGRPLAESNAILGYFAEGTPYLPTDRYERAQVYQWLFFEQYSHEPKIAVARFLLLVSGTEPSAEVIAELHAGGNAALAAMEGHLATREWFVGGRSTIADIALYAYTHVAEEGGFDLTGYPAIGRWLQRVAAEPGHITIDA